MTRFVLTVLFFGALFTVVATPCVAQDKEKKPVDPKAALATKVTLTVEPGLGHAFLAKAGKVGGVMFVINRTAFQRAGLKDFDEATIARVDVKNVPLSKVLTDTLKAAGATYQVDKEYIEILPFKK